MSSPVECRMQGTCAHEAARYRCKFPAEYALANRLDHLKAAYVRESSIVPKRDEWLAQLFDDANLDATCEALAMAGEYDEGAEVRAEAARRKIADCDSRLARYRRLSTLVQMPLWWRRGWPRSRANACGPSRS